MLLLNKLLAVIGDFVQPRSLGLINGLLTLSVWSVIGLFVASNWFGAIPVIVFVLIPLSALVAWRSATLGSQLIKGSGNLKLYAWDGFKWGVISGAVFWTWSISTQVLAAGAPLMGASFIQVLEYIFTISLPFTLIFGLAGLLHSIVFYYLNRWLVANYS